MRFTINYTYHLGDVVEFTVNGQTHVGKIQNLNEIPDVWVESTDDGTYRRYRLDVTGLKLAFSSYDDSGISYDVEYDKGEPLEFVHKGEYPTSEYNEIEITLKNK